MPITKESIAENCTHHVEGNARFRDMRRFGTASSLFDSQSTEERIWWIRSKIVDFPSLSAFFVDAYLISEDGDWGVIECDLMNWKGLKPIGREAAIAAISESLVSAGLSIEPAGEWSRFYSMRSRWNDCILLGEGSPGFLFYRETTTA